MWVCVCAAGLVQGHHSVLSGDICVRRYIMTHSVWRCFPAALAPVADLLWFYTTNKTRLAPWLPSRFHPVSTGHHVKLQELSRCFWGFYFWDYLIMVFFCQSWKDTARFQRCAKKKKRLVHRWEKKKKQNCRESERVSSEGITYGVITRIWITLKWKVIH